MCADPEGPTAPRRPNILVVEDDMMIGMCIEDFLLGLGCDVVKAMRLEKAIQEIAAGLFDGALLDVNIAGKPVYPIAEILSAQHIPFAFVTGHDPDFIPHAYRANLVLGKPLVEREITQALEAFACQWQFAPAAGTAKWSYHRRPAVLGLT